ncbi:MAG: CoA-binding protein [Pseudomonadota bacterium]
MNDTLRTLLEQPCAIALVGASPNPNRPSHVVMKYLLDHGFEVIPVRPKVTEVLGRRCYARLEDIPVPVAIVDVFRRSEACPDIARSAAAIGARVLWLQEGVVSSEAAAIAREAGMEVVMNTCIKKVHAGEDL